MTDTSKTATIAEQLADLANNLEKLELWDFSHNIMVAKTTISDRTAADKAVVDELKTAVEQQVADTKVFVSSFDKDVIDNLHKIVDKAQGMLLAHGAKVGGVNSGCFYANRAEHDVIIKALTAARDEFYQEVDSVCSQWGDVISKVEKNLKDNITDEVMLKGALEKIPSQEYFREHCSFKFRALSLSVPVETEDTEALAASLLSSQEEVRNADEAFMSRPFDGFRQAIYNAAHARKSLSGMLGKKRYSIAKAIEYAKQVKASVSLYFRSGNEAVFLRKVYDLLDEISLKFVVDPKLRINEKLQNWCIEKYDAIVGALNSAEAAQSFLNKGESLFDDGFDLRDQKAMLEQLRKTQTDATDLITLALEKQQDEERQAARTVDELLAELECVETHDADGSVRVVPCVAQSVSESPAIQTNLSDQDELLASLKSGMFGKVVNSVSQEKESELTPQTPLPKWDGNSINLDALM